METEIKNRSAQKATPDVRSVHVFMIMFEVKGGMEKKELERQDINRHVMLTIRKP